MAGVAPRRTNFWSSSSPGQSVGRAENSGARVELTLPTVKFRGSQKSTSSDETDFAYGEGDGEREGQEEGGERRLFAGCVLIGAILGAPG